jgi:hypothetical protein
MKKNNTICFANGIEMSPVIRGRDGLLMRSIFKSYQSFNIILDAIIHWVIATLAMNLGFLITLTIEGFAIYPPAKFSAIVGNTFSVRMSVFIDVNVFFVVNKKDDLGEERETDEPIKQKNCIPVSIDKNFIIN